MNAPFDHPAPTPRRDAPGAAHRPAHSRHRRLIVGSLVLVTAGAACGGAVAPTSSPSPATATSAVSAASDAVGLIDVGNGRHVYAECRGTGSPTVVLISGKGNSSADWHQVLDPADPVHDTPGDDVGAGLGDLHRSDEAVFPAVADFTRVCTYDRPDTDGSRSTPAAQPHSVDRDVNDLHHVLGALDEPGPFVLVAHSYGGLIATLFARTYPTSVAGLVMVDAASELITDVLDPAVTAHWDASNQATSPQSPEGVQLLDAFAQIDAAPPMPAVPVIVLSADKPYRTDLIPPVLAAELPTFADWLDAQALLAAALHADHVTATASGHNVYLYSPAIVVAAIRDVVDRTRTGSMPS